jgi:hypothetical protein
MVSVGYRYWKFGFDKRENPQTDTDTHDRCVTDTQPDVR